MKKALALAMILIVSLTACQSASTPQDAQSVYTKIKLSQTTATLTNFDREHGNTDTEEYRKKLAALKEDREEIWTDLQELQKKGSDHAELVNHVTELYYTYSLVIDSIEDNITGSTEGLWQLFRIKSDAVSTMIDIMN